MVDQTKFKTLAPVVMNDLMSDFHLTDQQAAGILGNLGHECAGFTILREIGQLEGKGGYGWAQWTGPRRGTFLQWCKDNGNLDWKSDDANSGFLKFELHGSEAGSIRKLKEVSAIEDATENFMDNYLRPGTPHLNMRIEWAKVALATFHI
jgi:hypothetical protein